MSTDSCYAVSYAEAARKLGYKNPKTIQRLVAAGKLRKIGRRITIASLERYTREDTQEVA